MPLPPTLQGEPTIAQEGKAVVMLCVVEAEPIPSVQWSKDGKPLEKADGRYQLNLHKKDKENTYDVFCEIPKYDAPLSGQYKATITNSEGCTFASFDVQPAPDGPKMIGKPVIAQTKSGNSLKIKVKAESEGETTFKWFANDKALEASEKLVMTAVKDTEHPKQCLYVLEIKNPAKSDEAHYRCEITSSTGTSSQAVDLAFD